MNTSDVAHEDHTPADFRSAPLEPQQVALLYDGAWRKAEVFFEWRHKLMAFTATVVGAGIVAAGWLIDKGVSNVVVGFLLLFLAGLARVSGSMDHRVAEHMRDAYLAGAWVEHKITGRPDPRKRPQPADDLPLAALLTRRDSTAVLRRPKWQALCLPVVAVKQRISPSQDSGSLTTILDRAYFVTSVVLAVAAILVGGGIVRIHSAAESSPSDRIPNPQLATR